LDPHTQQDFVVWGAGDSLAARYRQRQPNGWPGTVSRAVADGSQLGGYVPGYDDILDLAIVDHVTDGHNGLAILTGRDNGHLSLVSALPARFGQRLADFSPSFNADGLPRTPDQDTINSLDLLRDDTRNLVAATTKTSIMVYALPSDDASEIAPLTIIPFSPSSEAQLCRATWMSQGTVLAIAAKGCKDPLRYACVTPDGWAHHTAAKNAHLEGRFGLEYGNICPNSLTPIQTSSGRGPLSLLLSAWRDGTCREATSLQCANEPEPIN
jgi:hypothetical protein